MPKLEILRDMFTLCCCRCDLQSFVTWFSKAKRVPNITQLATSQMPAGRGRKGGIPPRKRRKTVPAESRKSFSDILPLNQSNASQQEPVNAYPTSHQNLSQEPMSIAFPCRSSVHHTNVSVTGSASVNLGAPFMTTVLLFSPPPLIQALPETSPETSPFTLAFITGNIRVCCGCRQKYTKPAFPPHNLCVRHKQWQSFGPMNDCQTRFGNVTSTVTYHASRLFGQIFILKCSTFPQVWLFSSYLHTLSSSEGKCQDDCNSSVFRFWHSIHNIAEASLPNLYVRNLYVMCGCATLPTCKQI